jgi:hypothetical protein
MGRTIFETLAVARTMPGGSCTPDDVFLRSEALGPHLESAIRLVVETRCERNGMNPLEIVGPDMAAVGVALLNLAGHVLGMAVQNGIPERTCQEAVQSILGSAWSAHGRCTAERPH